MLKSWVEHAKTNLLCCLKHNFDLLLSQFTVKHKQSYNRAKISKDFINESGVFAGSENSAELSRRSIHCLSRARSYPLRAETMGDRITDSQLVRLKYPRAAALRFSFTGVELSISRTCC